MAIEGWVKAMSEDKRNAVEQQKRDLNALDENFIRVLEDVIDALLANGALRLTDLPPQAMEKLNQRKQVRERLRNSLDLLSDDEGLI